MIPPQIVGFEPQQFSVCCRRSCGRGKVYRVSRAIPPGMSAFVTAKIGIPLRGTSEGGARAGRPASECPVYPNRDPQADRHCDGATLCGIVPWFRHEAAPWRLPYQCANPPPSSRWRADSACDWECSANGGITAPVARRPALTCDKSRYGAPKYPETGQSLAIFVMGRHGPLG